MKNLISRWFVPRRTHEAALARNAQLTAALETAFTLICNHHSAGVNMPWWGYCPVCHHADGSEPEHNQIKAALGRQVSCQPGCRK